MRVVLIPKRPDHLPIAFTAARMLFPDQLVLLNNVKQVVELLVRDPALETQKSFAVDHGTHIMRVN